MAVRFNVYLFSIIDSDSAILPGAQLHFYETGSSTPLATYADPDLTIPNSNPVEANADGRFPDIWLQPQDYKVQLTDPDGVVLDTLDPVMGTVSPTPGSVGADDLQDGAATMPKLGADVIERFADLEAYESANAPITVDTTKTIGAGGDFATLVDAWAWISPRRIVNGAALTFQFLTGEHQVTSLSLNHPDVQSIHLLGQPMTGDVPVNDEMTISHNANISLIKERFPSCLTISGSGSNHTGLAFPRGIGSISRLALFPDASTCRYSLVFGEWGASYLAAEGRASAVINRIALYGGVWGIWAIGAYIANTAHSFLGGQQADGASAAGAPIGLNNSVYRGDVAGTVDLQLFALDCQYGVYAVDSNIYADNCLNIAGASTGRCERGIYNRKSYISATSATFSQCNVVVETDRGGFTEISSATIMNCSADSKALPSFEVYASNYAPADSLFCLGADTTVNVSSASLANCTGAYIARVYSGANLFWNNVTVPAAFVAGTGAFLFSGRAYGEGKISGPISGPSAILTAQNGSYVVATGSTGLEYAPAANTVGADQSFIKV